MIPPGVIRNIYEAARDAKERTLFVAPEASHLIITDLRAKDPERLDQLLDLMTRMLVADGSSGRA